MVRVVFIGTEESDTNQSELEVYVNDLNEVYISISDSFTGNNSVISLDKPTAIKFHRELKKQISFIEEGGQND
jgi:hypothetical protein